MANIIEKAQEASSMASQGLNTLSSVSSTVDSIKNSILGNKTVDTSKINEVTSAVSSAVSSAESAMGSLTSISDALTSSVKDKLSAASETLNNAKSALDTAKNAISSVKKKTSQDIKVVDEKDSSIYNQINLTREEAMAYDPNGMKHFMNIWLGIMTQEGIPYTTLGMRRWGVDTEDKKVYGNAFLERQSSQTFKTLDSDGKLYWLSDYNSRHYYGEAADITGSLDGILDAVAKNDNVLDCMHKFGICMQIEVSESGHSKGTHFHCSTDKDNPQTKFWGVVNRIRETNDMPLYTVVTASDYFEIETKNTVKFA